MVGKKWIGGAVIMLLAGAVAVGISKNVFAGAEDTTDGDVTGTDRPCTTGVCYGHALGGGWKKYDVTSDNIIIAGETIGEKTFEGGALLGCQTTGATEYLRLAPALFSNGGTTFVRQLGLLPVDEFQSDGWTYNIAVGNISQAEAFRHFLAADALDGTRDGKINGNHSWLDISAFCYKPGDEKIIRDDTFFYTQSSVTVGGEEITGGKTVTSERDGKATLKLSTDKASVTVDFSHIVGFDPGDFSMNSSDTTSGDTVTTKWKVEGVYSVGEHSSTTWRPDSIHEETPAAAKSSVTINLEPGETKEKCSTIKYTRRKAKLTGTPVTSCSGWACAVDHYDYTASYSGSEDSEVCVEVTRPNPPSGKPKNPDGDVNGKIMFAGETSSLIWDEVKATSIETRRLAEWQAIKFLVGSDKPHNAANFVVNPDTSQDPCTMYRARFGITDGNLCKTQDSGTWDTSTSSSHSKNYSTSESVKVPDNIGDKYCNSFGYKLEYWYGIEGSNVAADNGWHRDRSYWYNYGAACRTIAKRPSTAFWNGSIRTKEGISTSLAQRHNSITFGDAPDNNRTLFGSWTEYLVAANQNLDSARTMASGAALSNGSSKMKLCEGAPWEANSALTISNFTVNSNFCALAPSGNIANSVLLTRLNAYLRDVADNPNITKTGDVASLYGGVTGNTVVVKNGDLEITNNIVINDIPDGYTLHSVPQAVIFVNNGDVKISSNVTRIDAWIIATGSSKGVVRTCWNYNKDAAGNDAPGTTTSDAVGSAGNNCTKQLSLNGPIIARGLDLRRSFGADNTAKITQGWRTNGMNEYSVRQSSAEIFNLRADTYLWAYAQAARYGSSYQEVYLNELAPRY